MLLTSTPTDAEAFGDFIGPIVRICSEKHSDWEKTQKLIFSNNVNSECTRVFSEKFLVSSYFRGIRSFCFMIVLLLYHQNAFFKKNFLWSRCEDRTLAFATGFSSVTRLKQSELLLCSLRSQSVQVPCVCVHWQCTHAWFKDQGIEAIAAFLKFKLNSRPSIQRLIELWDMEKYISKGEPLKPNVFIKILCIYSSMFQLQSPSKYSSFGAIRLSRHFFYCTKVFELVNFDAF